MKNQSNEVIQPQIIVPSYGANYYEPSRREKSTPYYQAYLAARGQRVVYEDPIIEQPTPIKVKKPRRTLFVILILILMLAVVGTIGLNFVSIDGLDFISIGKQAGAKDEYVPITVGDIVFGTLLKWGIEIDTESIFYEDCIKNIDDVEVMAIKIAYYALPVAYIIAMLVSVALILKALLGLTSQKRRKFGFIAFFGFLITLLPISSFLVWNGMGLGEIMDVVMGKGSSVSWNIGSYIITGSFLLASILSMFAYSSDKEAKQVKKEMKNAKKSIKKQRKLAKKAEKLAA